MRLLDRRIHALEKRRRLGVTRLGLVALAGVPEQPADLAQDARRGSAVAAIAKCLQHGFVVLMRNLAPACRAAQIGDALAQLQSQRRLPGRAQRRQRLLVKAKRVVIGVDHAGAIAGRSQVARAFLAGRAQAEVMAEQGQIFEPFGAVAAYALEGGADLPVHFGSPLQQKVLVDDVLQDRLGEAVALRRQSSLTRLPPR